MIGIVPGTTKTYEIDGDFHCPTPIEGKLYYDPKTGRLYYFSTHETRSSPSTGYYPIWDGTHTYISKFSNEKYFDDCVKMDLDNLCHAIDPAMADSIRYNQRRTEYQELLKPEIINEDNFFTQIVKGCICAMDVTMVDLFDLASPKLTHEQIETMYSSLSKITLMRMDKWLIWMNSILHKAFTFGVYKDDALVVQYEYPQNSYSVSDASCQEILSSKDDFLKKLIKITMVKTNLNKSDLRSDTTDEYTINNLMTSLNGNKPLSAQLFSRFMDMANYSYLITILNEDGSVLFTFKD